MTAEGETHREPARRPSVLTRLHTGVLFNLAGGIFAQGSTFALNLVSANLLGRFAFGEFFLRNLKDASQRAYESARCFGTFNVSRMANARFHRS